MIYIGIDVAKDKHDCFITNSDSEVLFKAFTIFNNLDGFNDLYQKIESVMDDVTKVKVGLSDPVVLSGNAIAQRIKATLGITGLSLPRGHIDGVVWHLDVGSSHPGAVAGPKGWAVRPLKRYASWVQNVVRQFGPYPARA